MIPALADQMGKISDIAVVANLLAARTLIFVIRICCCGGRRYEITSAINYLRCELLRKLRGDLHHGAENHCLILGNGKGLFIQIERVRVN